MDLSDNWRQQIAEHIAREYRSIPHVSAVMIGGSTARGHADKFSDIEIGVFWSQPPTEEERRIAQEKMDTDLIRIYPYFPEEEVWCDDFMIGRAAPEQIRSGILVEIAHHTTEMVDRVIGEVMHNHNPDEGKHNLISGIIDGIPIHGGTLLQGWKKSATPYPDQLAQAVIKKYAQIDHFWRWEMFLARSQNLMMVYQLFSQVETKILHMLLGLNKEYYFGFKWIDLVGSRLKICPSQLLQKLRQVYLTPPAEGASLLAGLVDDTYDLIESHFPTLDMSWYREVFHYQRPLWSGPPPYPAAS